MRDDRTISGFHYSNLIPPYGGKLVNLIAPEWQAEELRMHANTLPSVQLSERSVCDLELLATGAFSPLDRFMSREDYQSVLDGMRLSTGQVFPIPLTLPVVPAPAISLDNEIALRGTENELLAVMTITEIYAWDWVEVAEKVYGTVDMRHPLVTEMQRWGKLNISGFLKVFELPRHYDFPELRLTPSETRARLDGRDCRNVVAFQTRNSLPRLHEELTKQAVQKLAAVLLLQPVVGMTNPGDLDYYNRICKYKAFASTCDVPNGILLSLLPLAMRLAGARGALWHALIQRNYGANYLIVERDHASPGTDSKGKPFYGPYEAQELLEKFRGEMKVDVVPFHELVYQLEESGYGEESKIKMNSQTAFISGTRRHEEYLSVGKISPPWRTTAEVAEIPAARYIPPYRQGVCIWFTGLCGAGKSTTAKVLAALLLERGRQVTILDGDIVRTHLSRGLGFSKEDRDTNIRRIGFVAAEIVRHGGVVICATVSPYLSTRSEVRNMVGRNQFVEVFVNTPLEVCEERDRKGMYARARRGAIKGFTGIDDPYEPPLDPDATLDTQSHNSEENAQLILELLISKGFVRDL